MTTAKTISSEIGEEVICNQSKKTYRIPGVVNVDKYPVIYGFKPIPDKQMD